MLERSLAWIGKHIGSQEVLLILGLAAIEIALWPSIGRLALLPVGLALVWVALPTRRRFLDTSSDSILERKR